MAKIACLAPIPVIKAQNGHIKLFAAAMLIVVSLPAFAGEEKPSSPDLNKDLGFFSIQSAGTPAFVAEAAKSVFQVKVAFAADIKAIRQVDVSNGKGVQVKQQIRAISPSPAFDELDKQVLITEIEACEGYSNPENQKSCTLFITNVRGTAFLLGDGKTLWTNAHVIEPFLKTIQKLGGDSVQDQLKAKSRVLIFGFDANKNLVLNPFTNATTIASVPTPTSLAEMRNSFYAEDSDYLSLTLSQSIGTPLRLAKSPSSLGDKITVLGYPFCTACDLSEISGVDPVDFADRSPKPNSNGKAITVTSGETLDRESLQSFFQIPPQLLTLWNMDRMMFVSADIADGS